MSGGGCGSMVEAIRLGDIPGVQLRCRQRLGLAPDEAWRWLVEPEKLERWLADRAVVEPGPSGHLTLERQEGTGGSSIERGQTLEIAPPRRWVLAFRRESPHWEAATRLTMALAERTGGCELDVFQQGFERLALSECLTIWEEYRRRWRDALKRLQEATGT